MLLGFKTELKLNGPQRVTLAKHAGVARHAYNWGLALCQNILSHNREYPLELLKFPTAIDLHKLLVAMVKSENHWYYEVSKCAPQYALKHLADAFKAFWTSKKGFPNFKKKWRHDSFTLDGSITVSSRKIRVPVIGCLKTYERLPQGINPKSVTISRTADRWFISFKFEVSSQATPKKVEVVGIDLGINHLATLSTGEVFEGAKSYKKLSTKLARIQWLNRRKVKGSGNWKKAQIKIARLHRHIANIRSDTLHKITTYIAKNHGVIGIEDLNVSGMMANHKLASAIADMGFSEFRRQLEYKCQLYGSQLVVVDRFFPRSKKCSNCGVVKESLSLSQRVFRCETCNNDADRDFNASVNLETAVSYTVTASRLDSADTSRVTEEEDVSDC
ncbi:RNA-guided endonuclease InsQ/TnpB family protein [Limnofasciculus baicalensis]|uniref:Transposase n=1 Tax=Limnofasciculus baicalensis BBK-W-15 TaxID=2699891 RepID=A0AAE3GUX7_9CYAN|nr:transposase [Limnofasciculus baicalensis]MCP2731125.1 transposase [Limnofasciculus baicalensis BBK-W-15]